MPVVSTVRDQCVLRCELARINYIHCQKPWLRSVVVLMQICIGPVCIPMNLLLPFLIGVLHRYGWFKWFKAEWVTFRYWGQQCKRCVIFAFPLLGRLDQR